MKKLMFLAARKSWMFRFPGLVLMLGSVLLISFMPLMVCGGTIKGTVNGSTATATGNYDVTTPETLTSTTIDISYFTSCYFITNGIAGKFDSYHFVFAGQGAASEIPNIDASDFTISQYKPWVVNNNATNNFVSGPDVVGTNLVKHYRGFTNQDVGGADIVISYTPQNPSDPTNVNFLQAYIESTNGSGFTSGTIDNGGSGGPYYNEGGVSGTGTTNQSGTIPLVSSADTPAWIVDIPYTPEWGFGPVPVDEAINSQTVTFQTFISGQKDIGGTIYNVLYGGVQWGYTFTTVDVPEPTMLVLLGVGGLAMLRRRRGKTD